MTDEHQPPQLTAEELNRGNPNHDAFWQARGLKKRPKDWQQRIAHEKAARAKQLQREQKEAARQARIEREQAAEARALRDRRAGLPAAGEIEALEAEYDPFRRSRDRRGGAP
ncbi:MAG: hypothetical protein F4Y08_04965 [Caldilineaceae bacterium SB0662_bin_9]|uniref:Uncharacterized protein n=1 Tax=Caldilineaceae bacterium SB0662_bin_9 TaxID=2605258 RepID=A0A6B1DQP3_9CHLR|nr:hypothetical protein [Caldilineaceae bacterium SB0662_bin_9]